ncbi:MAG: hypothetical protein Q8P18_30760 [Pseudomonadota bacterium]|nr:hypothetical protein [Pseudomonadota bacterium]
MSKSRAPQKPARIGPDYSDPKARATEREARGNQHVNLVLSSRKRGIKDEDQAEVSNLETLALGATQVLDNAADSAWDAVPALDRRDMEKFAKRMGLAVETADMFDSDLAQISAGIAAMNAKPDSNAAAWSLKGMLDMSYSARDYARAEVRQAMETRTLHGEEAEGGAPALQALTEGNGFGGEMRSLMEPVSALVVSGESIYQQTVAKQDATGDQAVDLAIGLSEGFDGLDVTSADAGWLWLSFVEGGPSRDTYNQLNFILGRDEPAEAAPPNLVYEWEAREALALLAEDAQYSDGFGGFTDGENSFVNLEDAKTSKRARDARAAAIAMLTPDDPSQMFGWPFNQTGGAGASSDVATPAASSSAYEQGSDASGGRAGELGGHVKPVDATKASKAQSISNDHVVDDMVVRGDAVHDRQRKGSGSLEIEQGKVTGTGGMSSQTNDGQGNLTNSSGSANLSLEEGGKIGFGGAGSHSKGTEENSKGHSANAGAVIGPDGVVINAGVAREGTRDGEAYKQSLGASVDTEKRQATVDYSNTTGEKLKEKGGSGSATMGMDDDFNLNFFELGGKYKTGKGGSVGGKVSFGVEVGKPLKDGTGWSIEWAETQGISASAGKDGGGPKNKAGGSVSYTGASKTGGKRVFKTKEEAEAYAKKLKSGEVPTSQSAEKADDALKLKEGETAKQSDMNGLAIEGHGNYGMVSAGASVSKAAVDESTVSRGPGKTVFVERAHTSMSGGSVSAGLGGVGASKGGGSGSMDARKIAFDLSTPAGRMAYERYVKDGTLLPMPNAWREVAREKATMDSDSWGVSMPGVAFNKSSEVVDGQRTGDEGKVEYSVGTQKTGLKITGWGHANASHGMEIVEANDKERFYTARSAIDNSERDDDARALGKATGGYTGHQSSGYFNGEDSRGKWNATSVFTEEQVMGGVGREAKQGRMGDAGDHEDRSKLPAKYQGSLDGQDAMAAAMNGAEPDMDLFRRGMARWVADDGLEAITKTRNLAGFKDYKSTGGHGRDDGQTYYLDLEGDAWWTGFTGWKLGEKQAADLEQRAGDSSSDKQTVLTEVGTLSQYYKEKMAAVAAYDEVPIHLIRQEQKRCRELRDRLEKIAATARATSVAVEDEEAQQSVLMPAITQGDARFDRIQKLQAQLAAARNVARGAYHEANHWHGIHHLASWPGGGTPRKSKGMKHEAKAYEETDSEFAKGKTLMMSAKVCEELFEGAAQNSDATGAALQYIARAKSLYQRATPILQGAYSSYRSIGYRNTGDIALWWDDMEKHYDAPLDY